MEPLIALVAVTGIGLLVGALKVRPLRRLPTALRGGLAAMFLLTGGAHFVGMRQELMDMVPPALPAPGLLVTLTGVAELVGALALLWRATSGPAAGALGILLIVMFPANVYAADTATLWWDRLVPRTVTQLVFVSATATVLADRLRDTSATGSWGRIHLGLSRRPRRSDGGAVDPPATEPQAVETSGPERPTEFRRDGG
ncbi:hypothetical protein OG909_16725 [Streptomyces sp. NBC_01754]|uniref:DoxX family protein n=1 Tax=Streptomyces sp. NBC_01754 TaxID=2975930 RepID=UPI002DD969B6|nr:hypothetical protein [Streptomyces sp. NBC_01754]WSC93790.1 hypothetical protein OG909_16725 [Streptomyces sp. NBC_01754]